MSKISTYQLSDGGLYIGELNDNGLPHSSIATCTWPNGTAYRGSWINGTMCGVGTMYENGVIKYRGYWWKGELIHIFGTEELPRPETKLPKNKNKIAALLIGNNYSGTSAELPKCTADVDVIGQKLRNIGVDVTPLKNASETEIHEAINKISSKDNYYDHVLFYFSGHGETHHYHCEIEREDGTSFNKLLGPFHIWRGADHKLVYQEWDILKSIEGSKFQNVIIINDACQITKVYDFNDLSDSMKHLILEAYSNQNEWKDRNLLTANASLEGREASGWSNDKCGLYALGLIQYLEQKNLPIIKMLEQVNKFVVEYSRREKGEILQQPNATYTRFNTDFCLYEPEE